MMNPNIDPDILMAASLEQRYADYFVSKCRQYLENLEHSLFDHTATTKPIGETVAEYENFNDSRSKILAAHQLAEVVKALIENGHLDARTIPGDALLEYGWPPTEDLCTACEERSESKFEIDGERVCAVCFFGAETDSATL